MSDNTANNSVDKISDPALIKIVRSQQTAPIKSCILDREAILSIAESLQTLAREALDKHFLTLEKPVDRTPEEWKSELADVRARHAMAIFISGQNGEEIIAGSLEALKTVTLPKDIKTITFDSALSMRASFSVDLQNSFVVTLDMSLAPSMRDYDPWNSSTPNISSVDVRGVDATWVSGAFKICRDLFSEQKTRRNWLHTRQFFTAFNWVAALPVAIVFTYFIDKYLYEKYKAPDVIRISFDIYLILVMLAASRFGLELLRRLFPIIELKGTRHSGLRITIAAIFSTIVISTLGRLLWEIGLLAIGILKNSA